MIRLMFVHQSPDQPNGKFTFDGSEDTFSPDHALAMREELVEKVHGGDSDPGLFAPLPLLVV
jgi:hypothetical protein